MSEVSPFYLACRNGDLATVQHILPNITGDEKNRVEPNGSTALHAASYFGHHVIVKLLLENGCATWIRNKYNNAPCDEAHDDEIRQLFRRPDRGNGSHRFASVEDCFSVVTRDVSGGSDEMEDDDNIPKGWVDGYKHIGTAKEREATVQQIVRAQMMKYCLKKFQVSDTCQDVFKLLKKTVPSSVSGEPDYDAAREHFDRFRKQQNVNDLVRLYTFETPFYDALQRNVDSYAIELYSRLASLQERAFTGGITYRDTNPLTSHIMANRQYSDWLSDPASNTHGSHASIGRIVWTDDNDHAQIDQKTSFVWYWCFKWCIIGSLLAGIGLAIVLTFWLTSKTTETLTTTTLTTDTTTTTALPTCNSTCGNDTTILSVSLFARWNFENTFDDLMLTYNGTSTNGPTFVVGYIGQALSLNSASNQYLSTSFIPINSKSFTVDAWIYPTSFPNTKGIHTIAGLCPQQTAQQCFQFGLHSNVTSTTSTGYFGLWEAADLRGSMSIPVNQWTHVAIVYSKSKTKQVIYVNGNLDNSRGTSNGFNGTSGTFYIGNNYDLTSNPSFGTNNFQGYIDQLTVSNGVRSTCEILNVATMACRLSFDNSTNFLADSGPNDVSVNAYNYISASGLKGSQAISFTTSSSSYLQATGFLFLSYNNAPFSISLWIQPTLLQGTLVGSSLGYDPLTFASNGSLIARVATVSVSYNILLELTPIWSHIVLTWSSSGGLNLYINNILVKSIAASTSTGSGASTNNFILGGGSFSGTIDEWRLYSRELPANDVCAIFTN
ncbi:unnamed protein product [Adineta steineri]|uniref:LamG-like jellyroll fold domain-containing protein n=2 Tax=Adineta steineri TaxID=433720 RepID=A0A819EK24_9BILA|nr:unnamed protein product [Adineta steineri]